MNEPKVRKSTVYQERVDFPESAEVHERAVQIQGSVAGERF